MICLGPKCSKKAGRGFFCSSACEAGYRDGIKSERNQDESVTRVVTKSSVPVGKLENVSVVEQVRKVMDDAVERAKWGGRRRGAGRKKRYEDAAARMRAWRHGG